MEEQECDCCGAESPVGGVRQVKHMHPGKAREGLKYNICRICSGTFTFNAFCYPDQYGGNKALFQVVACVGNMIRKDIAEIPNKRNAVEVALAELKKWAEDNPMQDNIASAIKRLLEASSN
jgi:hypothetical protein